MRKPEPYNLVSNLTTLEGVDDFWWILPKRQDFPGFLHFNYSALQTAYSKFKYHCLMNSPGTDYFFSKC